MIFIDVSTKDIYTYIYIAWRRINTKTDVNFYLFLIISDFCLMKIWQNLAFHIIMLV